jgi:hypothetical protein
VGEPRHEIPCADGHLCEGGLNVSRGHGPGGWRGCRPKVNA